MSNLLSKASIVLTPTAYSDGDLHCIKPNTATGDFDFTRSTTATRENSSGNIESVAANLPRIDYLGGTGHILLEPQSTNTATYSNDFTQGDIFVQSGNPALTNSALSTNQSTAPDGTTTANKLTDNNDGATGAIGVQYSSTHLTSGEASTFSIFVKKDTVRYFIINFANYDTSQNTSFDLDTGTVNRGTGVMTDYGGGWYRCSATFTTTTDLIGAVKFFITENASGTGGTTRNGTNSTFLWGIQAEEQSFPTSYIPTSGSTATRNADDCKLDNFGSMPSNYPITVYGEVLPNELSADSHAFSLLQNIDTSGSYYLSLELTSTTGLKIKRRDTDTDDADTISHTLAVGTPFKFAVCFQNETDYKYSFDGLSAVSVTTSDTVTWDYNDVLLGTLRLVSDTGSRNPIKEFRLYDTELTDAQLTELTT